MLASTKTILLSTLHYLSLLEKELRYNDTNVGKQEKAHLGF